MKVFISWSGSISKQIADALHRWLPRVIQEIKPFFSIEIEKGVRGINEINSSLENTSFGVLCLTRENLENTWIHYEAGALAKLSGGKVFTLLHQLKHTDVKQPLAQFQYTLTTREDISRLLKSINSNLDNPLDISVLNDSFDRWWPDLESDLKKIRLDTSIVIGSDSTNQIPIRPTDDILEEILELVRTGSKSQNVDPEFHPATTVTRHKYFEHYFRTAKPLPEIISDANNIITSYPDILKLAFYPSRFEGSRECNAVGFLSEYPINEPKLVGFRTKLDHRGYTYFDSTSPDADVYSWRGDDTN